MALLITTVVWGGYYSTDLTGSVKNGIVEGDTAIGIDFISTQKIQHKIASLNISPNPTSDFLTMEMSNTPSAISSVYISISDIYGRIIKRISTIETEKVQIDVQDLAEGIYLLSIDAGPLKAIKKFQIVR